MPATNDYLSICGPIPSPHTMQFKTYLEKYKAIRRADCVFNRATKYYIDPDTGSDSNAGTRAAPWATLANVRAALTGSAGVGSNTWATPVTNTSFRIKRGTILRDSTITNGGVLYITSAGIEICSYGAPVPGSISGCVEPIISNFTIQWMGGFSLSTPGGATNRRTLSLTHNGTTILNPAGVTSIGWIRVARGVSTIVVPHVTSPYAAWMYCSGSAISAGAQDNAAYALIEANPSSFYRDSSGVLNLNLGLLDPSIIDITSMTAGTCLEATPGLTTNRLDYDGIRVGQGSDQCYIHDIILEGYGAQCESYQNGSGLRCGNASEDVCYLENVQSYYNGRHALSMECDDAVNHFGGTLYKKGCTVGYCAPSGGANEDVCFANKGKAEYYNEDYTIRFGFLPVNSTRTGVFPANTFTGQGQVNKVAAWYGHSAATGAGYEEVNLYVLENATILDERDKWPSATVGCEGFGFADGSIGEAPFLAGTENDPTTYRCFVIGFKSNKSALTDQRSVAFSARSRLMFINCHLFYDIAWNNQQYIWQSSSNAIFLNTVFEVNFRGNQSVSNNLALALFRQNSAKTYNQRFLNCEIHVRGGDSTGFFSLCSNNQGQSSTWGIPLGNCLLINADTVQEGYTGKSLKIAYGAGGFSLVNDPANSSAYLRNLATYGVVASDDYTGGSGYWASGFGNASGLLNLETANTEIPTIKLLDYQDIDRPMNREHALAGRGSANPFSDSLRVLAVLPAPEYDYHWRCRPSVPSIGAFDIPSTIESTIVAPLFAGQPGNSVWQRLFWLGK